MFVQLSSCGNPDFGQHPDLPVYGCEPDQLVPITGFKMASERCVKFILNNQLGSGNWSGGQVYDHNKKHIANVSYNGRVWDLNKKEIKI